MMLKSSVSSAGCRAELAKATETIASLGLQLDSAKLQIESGSAELNQIQVKPKSYL